MTFRAVLLILALGVASCDDSESPSSPGTLIASTSTTGNQTDRDGYVLTVVGTHSPTLGPTDRRQPARERSFPASSAT